MLKLMSEYAIWCEGPVEPLITTGVQTSCVDLCLSFPFTPSRSSSLPGLCFVTT